MRIENDQLSASATDLAKHLACHDVTALDLLSVRGELQKPSWYNALAAILEERGLQHEAAYLTFLSGRGLKVFKRDVELTGDAALEWTKDAMHAGWPVIVQADLKDGNWRGRADVLLRIEAPSQLGSWSYEVVDTKLARETRGGTILQLSL